MNRLGAPQCSDACIEFVCLFQIWPLGSSLENLVFDRSNCRLSFSVASKLIRHLSTIVGLVVCFSIFVAPALLLKYLLLDPFAILLDLFCHHSLSQFLHPSRCSAQSHLSRLSAAANDHPNCLAWDRHELLLVLTSSLSSLVLATRPFWAFPIDGLGGSPGLTVAFLNISALPLSVSHGNTCASAW